MEKIKVFNVEELHRGDWQPLMLKESSGGKIQKTVKITEHEAERMNVYSDDYKIRYVLANDVKKSPHIILDNEKQVKFLRGKVGMMKTAI